MPYEQIWYQWPIAEQTFLIVIHRFSLAKAAMNSPCMCKMRNGVQLKRRRPKTLKGSQRTGGGQIFLKNLRYTNFNKDLSNEPNYGQIHLAGQYL
jgi:hypothetical protein